MSSHKQKMLENERYPHIKRGWIKAIKAIRNRGGYSKENISGGTSARTGCLSETSEDCSGRRRLHQASRPGTLDGGGNCRKSKPQICHRKELAPNASPISTKRIFGEQKKRNLKNTRSSNADIPHLQAMDANKRKLGDPPEGTREYGNLPNAGFQVASPLTA